jgi:Cu-Zn family superoxide dismutase
MRLASVFLILIFAYVVNIVGGQAAAESNTVKIALINAKQQKIGDAVVVETPTGVLIRLDLERNPEGISPGTHAVHIHEVGRCEPPFNSAGGHFNPSKQKHGFFEKNGMHAGDLANIHVVANTPLAIEYFVPQLSLSAGKTSLMDADGSALVIHESADDYRTDPAGNSGDRVACGVINRSAQAK